MEKSANFAGFLREKSQNSRKNRPILRDFHGRKVKIRRKIGRFPGILAEKSQISKDFQGQILRKSGQFHEKCIWKYFWQISRYSAFFGQFGEIHEFRGSTTARNIRSPVLIIFFPKATCILILIIYLFMK